MIYYYKTSQGLEVDFLLLNDKQIELIQVCTTLEDENTFKRELRVFSQAQKELKRDIDAVVISFDDTKSVVYDGIKIEVINILEWLLLA